MEARKGVRSVISVNVNEIQVAFDDSQIRHNFPEIIKEEESKQYRSSFESKLSESMK